MIGILVQLLLSWGIIWLFEKGDLGFMGLFPTKKRLLQFLLFFLTTGFFCAFGYILKMVIAHQQWELNPEIDFGNTLNAIWWNIKSVLFEEFIFRGVLLYILIKKLGASPAILISSVAFGIYHWFSHELFGNPVAMTYEFLITGTMGVLLAYSYTKTRSLYIAIAIHLGWGIMNQVVFSDGPIGNQLLIEIMPRPIITVSLFSYFTMLLLHLVLMFLVNFFLLKKIKTQPGLF